MKSIWLTICVFTAVASLSLTRTNSDEPGNAPTPAADPMHGKVAGQIRDDNALKMKLVWCPPGFVTMENVEFITEPATKKDDNAYDDKVDPKDEPAAGAAKSASFALTELITLLLEVKEEWQLLRLRQQLGKLASCNSPVS